MLTRCEEFMAEVCDAFGVALTEFNAKHHHVHLPIHDPRPTDS
nr:transposase IS200-family protein [Rhodococcus sp. JVH1]